MSLKSADPLGTPIAALSSVRPTSHDQLPSMSTKNMPPIIEKPNYQSLVAEMQADPPVQQVYDDELPSLSDYAPPPPQQQPPPQPRVQRRRIETAEPSQEPYPPSRLIVPPATPAPPPPPAAEKPGLIEANKNLIVLFVVAALVLKFAAPKLRAYPRFVSNSELGLNLVGVVAVSVLIVSIYKLTVHMANLKS